MEFKMWLNIFRKKSPNTKLLNGKNFGLIFCYTTYMLAGLVFLAINKVYEEIKY